MSFVGSPKETNKEFQRVQVKNRNLEGRGLTNLEFRGHGG